MSRLLKNRTIVVLMLSDVLVLTGFGLITPILAIYIKDEITGGTIFAAGIATAIFWTIKSLVQIPLANFVDAHSHKVAKAFLVAGTFLVSLTPLLYIAADSVWWIYAAETVYALGAGLAYPSWLGIWSTHLDKKQESFQWSVYSTMVGIGTAIAGALGATLAELFGFRITFTLVALMSLVGCVLLFDLERRGEHLKEAAIPLGEKEKVV